MVTPEKSVVLETKLVGDITGRFLVPSYQRGYRWEEAEVVRLLEDVYAAGSEGEKKSYCLQPVVVRKHDDYYELIDGQQRLTTLFLVYKYMAISSGGFLIEDPRFSLSYETREKSETFLNNIDFELRKDNIDFWFICNAYEAIQSWFSDKKKSVMTDINSFFDKYVKVIWYEVGNDEDPTALFTRLNIGKIPLTSSELVKALFLSEDANEEMDDKRQREIALQWDTIERELHKESLWCFLTNRDGLKAQTRIDLILDLMAEKPEDSMEAYYTFFKFDEMRREKGLTDVWQGIQNTFLVLRDWYEQHDLYHQVGYLIASGSRSLDELYSLSIGKTKRAFSEYLESAVRESLADGPSYADMTYEKANDRKKMERLLLLFNVESVRQIDDKSQRFPFGKHKRSEGANVRWSLEHIHARRSEGMGKMEDWKEWLKRHVPFVRLVEGTEDLALRMDDAIAAESLERASFDELQDEAISALSDLSGVEYVHSISNMALLNTGDNAALSNSVFAVKRDLVLEMDAKGKYIPFCTKMVFLKYYTPSEAGNFLFWGQEDRIAYVKAMNRVLEGYLSSLIPTDEEA